MFKSILNSLPCMVAFWDTNLRCQFANSSYLEWFGRDPETMIGSTLMDLLGDELFELNEPFVRMALGGAPQTFERTLTKPDGSVRQTLAYYLPQRSKAGEVTGFAVQVVDITGIRKAEVAERLAAKVYESIAEAIIVSAVDGTIESVNPAFSEITGYAEEEVVGGTTRILGVDRDNEEFRARVIATVRERGFWKGEIWSRRKDGAAFLASQTSAILRGSTERYVSVFSDVTERWTNDSRQRELALRDPLTGVANRSLLFDRIARALQKAHTAAERFAVMFLDLDGFKKVNDSFGHDAGDTVLKRVAQGLVAEVRDLDTVARLGGDEFVIVFGTKMTLPDLERVGARILTAVKEPVAIGTLVAQVSASIGVSFFPDHGTTPEELLQAADSAMYAAKRTGKDKVSFAG